LYASKFLINTTRIIELFILDDNVVFNGYDFACKKIKITQNNSCLALMFDGTNWNILDFYYNDMPLTPFTKPAFTRSLDFGINLFSTQYNTGDANFATKMIL